MRILALNASHRGDQGHTRFLIDQLFQGARAAGADCEVVTLAKIKINRCLACNQCETVEHHLRCVYDDKDEVRAIFNKMAQADVITMPRPFISLACRACSKLLWTGPTIPKAR